MEDLKIYRHILDFKFQEAELMEKEETDNLEEIFLVSFNFSFVRVIYYASVCENLSSCRASIVLQNETYTDFYSNLYFENSLRKFKFVLKMSGIQICRWNYKHLWEFLSDSILPICVSGKNNTHLRHSFHRLFYIAIGFGDLVNLTSFKFLKT